MGWSQVIFNLVTIFLVGWNMRDIARNRTKTRNLQKAVKRQRGWNFCDTCGREIRGEGLCRDCALSETARMYG